MIKAMNNIQFQDPLTGLEYEAVILDDLVMFGKQGFKYEVVVSTKTAQQLFDELCDIVRDKRANPVKDIEQLLLQPNEVTYATRSIR